MNSISYHIQGIRISISELLKGNFLLYFIPGAVLTLLYLWFTYYTNSLKESYTLASDYSWIDYIFGWINAGMGQLFSIVNFISEQIYIFLVLTALSPFNTLLAEKLDGKLTGQTFKANLLRFINDIIRMIFVVILALMLEFAFILVYWVISFIIGFELLDTIVYFAISAFFFGFSFYDFALERYEIRLFGTLNFAFAKPLTMLLTGSLFLALYNIPVIGIPLAPVVTVMVSTVVYLYTTKKLPKQNTELKPETNA